MSLLFLLNEWYFYGDIIAKYTPSVKKYFLEYHFSKIMLDFEPHFEYNICHERIFKATMVNPRKNGVETTLSNYVYGTTCKRTTRSHRKLNTQTSSVPT